MKTLSYRNALIERYSSILPRLAAVIANGSGVDIDDVVSAGFLGLIAGCETVDRTLPEEEIKQYVMAAARNEMLRLIRKERKGGLTQVPARQTVTFVPVEDAERVPVDETFFDDSARAKVMRLRAGPLRATFLCLLKKPYATKNQIAAALSKGFGQEFTKNDVDQFIRIGRRKMLA